MVRLKNTARAKEAKAIMPASNSPERAPAPIFRRPIELCFRFAQNKLNRFVSAMRLKNKDALGPAMRRRVAKKLKESLLEEGRINLQGLVT